jgi:hypothetical protein
MDSVALLNFSVRDVRHALHTDDASSSSPKPHLLRHFDKRLNDIEDRRQGKRLPAYLTYDKLVSTGEQNHCEGSGDEHDYRTEAGELRRRCVRR